MTTNNPDPLEVAMLIGPFELKIRNQENYSGEHREWYETVTVPQGNPYVAKAAAAIIAQHYAPVIAENERLRTTGARLLEWWPEGSGNSLAGRNKGSGFADDLEAFRQALK